MLKPWWKLEKSDIQKNVSQEAISSRLQKEKDEHNAIMGNLQQNDSDFANQLKQEETISHMMFATAIKEGYNVDLG